MTTPTNSELLQHVASLQDQITRLATQLNDQIQLTMKTLELSQLQSEQINGLGAVQQVFAELVVTGSAEIKAVVAEATRQMLARPETIQNTFLADQLRELNRVASMPSRTTPDGRRAHFQVIPGDKPESET